MSEAVEVDDVEAGVHDSIADRVAEAGEDWRAQLLVVAIGVAIVAVVVSEGATAEDVVAGVIAGAMIGASVERYRAVPPEGGLLGQLTQDTIDDRQDVIAAFPQEDRIERAADLYEERDGISVVEAADAFDVGFVHVEGLLKRRGVLDDDREYSDDVDDVDDEQGESADESESGGGGLGRIFGGSGGDDGE